MVNLVRDTLTGEFIGTSGNDVFGGTRGGIFSAVIDSFTGNDFIFGINVNENGAGIDLSAIEGNAGRDIIMGQGLGANGVGIRNSLINGGGGNDIIIAEGSFVGVTNSLINGGAGNDYFYLERGTAIVIGEEGIDRLELDGLISDYQYQLLDDVRNTISITGGADNVNTTALIVDTIEEFVFDSDASGQVFGVDDLLSV